jgi:Outer membrane protein
MLKKIVLFVLLMIPTLGFAQSGKIAYFSYDEVMLGMPEFAQLTDTLQKQEDTFNKELEVLREEYSRKYTDYMEQQATLSEPIKIRRQQEIEDIGQRASNFQQTARSEQQALVEKYTGEIKAKIQSIVQQVGAENNFEYILEINAVAYASPQSINATPLIKQKLGIQ